MKNFKLLKPHRKGCIALSNYVSGKWDTPWAYLDNVSWSRYGRYWEAGCNDPKCKASVRVKEDEILKFIDLSLGEQ
jgi:hypothetical protein